MYLNLRRQNSLCAPVDDARHTGPHGRERRGCARHRGWLTSVLHRLGEYAEVEALGRATLAKQRRILGQDNHQTLVTSANLAVSLSRQGKHTEATEIEREVLVSMTRLLGAEHKNTLTSATNLAHSLAQCGKKMEAEQLLRDTLALARRALGPTHEHTQCVLLRIRALSLAVR